MLRDRKAQAILELAILGAIIISAFSIAISQSESAWRSLAIRQKAFRQAQQAAFPHGSASKQLASYPRMPNIISPMELGELQQFSGSGSVLWSDGKGGTGGESGEGSSVAPVDTTVTSGSGATVTAHYTTTFKKEESNGRIVTTRTLDVQEDNGRSIHRSREMQ